MSILASATFSVPEMTLFLLVKHEHIVNSNFCFIAYQPQREKVYDVDDKTGLIPFGDTLEVFLSRRKRMRGRGRIKGRRRRKKK